MIKDTALLRLLDLDIALRNGRCITLRHAANVLGVSTKTIRRDLADLENLGAPLVFDTIRKGYLYQGTWMFLPDQFENLNDSNEEAA